MRVGLVSREYPTETAKGGIASQTRLKARGLANRGHEVHVISESIDGARHEDSDGLVRVIRIPTFSRRMPIHTDHVEWLTYSAEVAAEVASLHARHPLDVLDFPEWSGEAYIHLLNRTEWNREPPVVIQIHGPLVMFAHTVGWPAVDSEFYHVGTEMECTCLRLADAVFASSAYSAGWCASRYGLNRSAISVLHAGVDTRHFRPGSVPKEARPTVVYAGKVAESKGVVTLVKACCLLAGDIPGLRLRLLGRVEAPFVRRLIEIVRAAGHDDLIELPGFVSGEDLPTELSRCHVFASPSPCEGGPGFAALEAMACELPVVACEGTGSSEVVTRGLNGLLVAPGDVASLAETLGSLLIGASVREEMGRRARRYVVAEADSEICLARLECFYQTVIRHKRTSVESSV